MGSVAHNGVCRAIDLGLIDYDAAFALQKAHVERLQRDEGDDVLIFVEHPHVITVGRNATGRAIVADRSFIEARGARVVATDRGGDVTYHGPGQLVGYPIVRLEAGRRDIRRYVHDLEQV
jgi:lipoyl(octanoyl) transferase